ncbi:MBL fold metallo-hydrolase [Nonomuraea sp. B10E15]|uniref:MBL fold metallo-hydrolase n=1 Tax=Nonomuraea sp. B10E15 TaxID=3153560 RepID=UPI00325ED4B0
MKVTKFTHACVRVEHEGRRLVIDPGTWTEPSALDGADAVLVTHEHGDHADVLRLLGAGVRVYAPGGAELGRLPYTPVSAGEELSVAGFHVRACGGRHAPVYDGLPDCANIGYLVEHALYHPGDSLHVPQEPVETLLVPLQASWLKTAEVIDFVRAVRARRAYGIHDAQVNERGLASVNGWLAQETGPGYRWLPPGGTL